MGNKNKGSRRRYRSQKVSKLIAPPNVYAGLIRKCLAALQSVKAGLSANQSAELHGIPPSSLKDWLSGRVKHGIKLGPAPYLTSKEVCMHLISLSKMGFGKTRRDVKQIAGAVATQKGKWWKHRQQMVETLFRAQSSAFPALWRFHSWSENGCT